MDLLIEIERKTPTADEIICSLFVEGKKFARVSGGVDLIDDPERLRKAFEIMLTKAASHIHQAQITIK